MKVQTYIAKIYNDAGVMIDFERFTYKRAANVEKGMKKLLCMNGEKDLFLQSYRKNILSDGGKIVKIYATPDGYKEDPEPVRVFNIQ